MEIMLINPTISLMGLIGRGYGYYIRSTKKGNFFGQRSKHGVPPDGHWRFIVTCAELVQNGLYINDIRVSRVELCEALWEAHHFTAAIHLRLETYNARDVLNLKTTFGL